MNINISELKEIMRREKINLIDIRSSSKYKLGTIPGSINIYENDLFNNYNKYLDKEKTYYIFCETGSSSKVLSNVLNAIGYKVYNILGGYSKYVLEK